MHRTMTSPRLAFAAALLAALAPAALAQPPKQKQPTVEQVRVGLPAAAATDPESGDTRRGAWAPVYVKIKAGAEAIPLGALRLVAESVDGEDAGYHYVTPLPFVEAEADCFAITYVRPGSTEVNLSLVNADGKVVPFLKRGADGRNTFRERHTVEFSHDHLTPGQTLYLALGSKLPALSQAFAGEPADGVARRKEDTLRQLAFCDEVRDLPDHWFGYDAVDIAVLATASDTFVDQLLDPAAAPRRKALGEWVRRGGKLIVAAGRNRQKVAALLDQLPLSEFDKQPLINCRIEGSAPGKTLSVFGRWATTGRDSPAPMQGVDLTVLRPGDRPDAPAGAEEVTVLVREAPDGQDKDGAPVVVHSACGLGRVVLTAFDLDAPPFNNWPGQKAFWEKMEAELEPRVAARAQDNMQIRVGGAGQDTDLGGDLKRGLESFQEVPVISFGWVALFILVYIVIVGPLDYLILKKVFKRLELTWITFPTVVLAISVAAYFTAYSLKGDDLRVNKIDVLDLDLHGSAPQAYGTTWVTLFSPRIQNYTIGVEPAAPAWADAPKTDARAPRPVVTVMEGQDSGIGRVGSQGLFRRPYAYAADAAGLEGVSIPVWSMRTFTARWRAPVTPGQAPVDAELRHARDKNDHALLGRLTNRLPVELRDVTLLYHGKSYAAGTVPPGGFLPIDNLRVGDQGKQAPQWLSEAGSLSAGSARTVTPPALIRDLLFHGPPAAASKPNGGWRPLDQSWRLKPLYENGGAHTQPQARFRDEVLLVARVASQAGRSEEVTRADASPTRLWLDALPGTRPERPALSGFIVQDVYVRVYIPVTP